ncbi:hypothetical protein niasHT_032235 [Heterodera trifolii]|uniref:Uncharacterized protein n=1 Tax=Heterodera trifolii TaxID=157864 RepID=A0ABD2HYA4_9BILA
MFSFGTSAMVRRNGLVINDPDAMLRHRIFKSLAGIMALLVGTYFSICFIRLLFRSVKDPFFNFHILSSVSALFTVTAASSNGLILFIFSRKFGQTTTKREWRKGKGTKKMAMARVDA